MITGLKDSAGGCVLIISSSTLGLKDGNKNDAVRVYSTCQFTKISAFSESLLEEDSPLTVETQKGQMACLGPLKWTRRHLNPS